MTSGPGALRSATKQPGWPPTPTRRSATSRARPNFDKQSRTPGCNASSSCFVGSRGHRHGHAPHALSCRMNTRADGPDAFGECPAGASKGGAHWPPGDRGQARIVGTLRVRNVLRSRCAATACPMIPCTSAPGRAERLGLVHARARLALHRLNGDEIKRGQRFVGNHECHARRPSQLRRRRGAHPSG